MGDEVLPDDKDWTWVLERRCDECGYEADRLDLGAAGETLAALGMRWTAVLLGRGADVRPARGVWSPLEYACHVRDVLARMDERVGLVLGTDGARFDYWDPNETAIEDAYSSQVPAAVAASVRAAGEVLGARLAGITGEQWGRRGTRSDGKEFTLATLVRYMMHEPVHHLADAGAGMPGSEGTEVTFATVDPASPEAAGAMARYFAELEGRFPGGFDSSAAVVAAAGAFAAPRGVFVVVRTAAGTVGCGGVQWLDDRRGEIKRMWVDPDARGAGIGRRLLQFLEAVVVSSGRSVIVLDTNSALTEAIAMYRANGYSSVERYNDNPDAELWFEKRL